MIISASRRTDIPTYYSEWFYNRIKEGFVYVRNPMNSHQVSKIPLTPDVVDGIVFWTKNPIPMMNRLRELDDHIYYFQFTITPYGTDIEPNIPSKKDAIIPAFQELSRTLGKERVIWRYDPILFNEKYTFEYHVRSFKALANRLAGYTEKCTVSFLDFYKSTRKNTSSLKIYDASMEQKKRLMCKFAEIAKSVGIDIDTCAEKIDLSKFGIQHAHCIDKERLERIGGFRLNLEKDKTQRAECGCVASIDIGAYGTCRNGCLYCYANHSQKVVLRNCAQHDPKSPLLFGKISDGDEVKIRKVKSCKDCR
ncbi:MAG: DUF1848 domain-containing protein [Thermocaproicibacter melissae]|jgi:hypothetical protein|uniref:DUF1848 domain-containing protein n=1 Tax=Thermocaproicibacter melissae TaxID=2966552 RepID=UPI003A100975